MIWVRRLLATVLASVFALAFLVAALVFGVNGTLLTPGFYTDTLRRVNMFDYFYDEMLPVLVERAELDVSDVPLPIDLSPEGIAAKVERVITPEWLEANLVAAVDEALPYFVGDKSSFRVTFELASRVEAFAAAVPDLLQEAELYDYVLEEGLVHAIGRRRQAFRTILPFGVVLTPDDVMEGLRILAPEAWLTEQVTEALDEAVPYLTGARASFRVVFSLQDRADVVPEVLRSWLARSVDGSAHDYLLGEHILPVFIAYLKPETELPFGVTLTQQEILTAFESGLPQEWVRERVDEAIEVMGPYLAGRTGAITLSIPLKELVSVKAAPLVEVVETRIRATYESLPPCTSRQTSALSTNVAAAPPCRPPRVTYEHFKIFVELDPEAEVENAIAQQLPARIRLTHKELFNAPPGTEAASTLEDVRHYLQARFTLDQGKLRRLLEEREEASPSENGQPPAWERFERMRGLFRNGFTISEADLRTSESFAAFDEVRRHLGTARRLLWPLIVVLVSVTALIGYLGGIRRGTRLIWAAIPLLLGGLLVVVFATVAIEPVRSLGAEVINGVDAERLFTTKLLELRDALIDDFFGRLLAQGVITALVALAAIAGGIIVDRRARQL